MRTSRPLTVTLGKQQASVDVRLESGAYASASEVVRAGLRALDREEQALNDLMKAKIKAALDSEAPDIPAADVFKRVRARNAARSKG
jgi:antitoxin ParD1/3/4